MEKRELDEEDGRAVEKRELDEEDGRQQNTSKKVSRTGGRSIFFRFRVFDL